MSLALIGQVGFNLGDHLSALLISFLALIMGLSLDLLSANIFMQHKHMHNTAFSDKLAFQNNLQHLHDRR